MDIELTIDAMHCERCADAIERYLCSQSGVDTASVDFESGRGSLTVSPDLEVRAIVEGLESMGYDASVDAWPSTSDWTMDEDSLGR